MEERPDEILSAGDGRYSFRVGRQRYSIATKLDEAHFKRVAERVRSMVEQFPQNFSQEEMLFLSLMAVSNEIVELEEKIEALAKKYSALESDDR